MARVFFDEPSKDHYLKEISRKADLSHTSVKKHLESLKEDSIIRKEEEKRGQRIYPIYKAKGDGEDFRKAKKIDMIHRLENSGLLEELEEVLSPDCIVLFGSTSRGEDIEESDIDLFVQGKEKEIKLSKYEKKLNRDIELHLNPDFTSYPEELKTNIANGIVLRGFLEVFK